MANDYPELPKASPQASCPFNGSFGTENCHCHCRHKLSGHVNENRPEFVWNAQPCVATDDGFDSNNISKQFLNLADRKNTNHLDKCVSSTFWRGAIRIYPVY